MNEDDQNLLEKLKGVLEEDGLDEVCRTLYDNKEHYDWVGIYFVEDGEKLVLEPFKGKKTIHTEIPFGSGVCGRVAMEGKTIIVDDVCKENEYLSCSPHVKSEIVVPIYKENEFVAEIDIDSNTENAFSEEDKILLENIAVMIGSVI